MSTQEYIRSITEIVPDKFPTLTPIQEVNTNSTTSGFFSNVSWQTWVILFLLLTLLGINIFAYLAKGTEETINLFAPILSFFGIKTLQTTKQTVETSATGTKAGIDAVAGTTTSALQFAEDTLTHNTNKKQTKVSLPTTNVNEQEKDQDRNTHRDTLSKVLDNASRSQDEPIPNDLSTGKSGWCYIGEDNGIRTCSEIGVNDVCLSGDIFPTQTVCMNPNLRA